MSRKYSKKRKQSIVKRKRSSLKRKRSSLKRKRSSLKRKRSGVKRKRSSLKRKQTGGRVKLYENVPGVIELSSKDFRGQSIAHQNTRGKPGIVMMYADWCPHCNNPETRNSWGKLGRLVDGNNGYVAAMNCAEEENKGIAQQLGITGYPTVLFVKPEGTLYK